jgi:hypothetical protein
VDYRDSLLVSIFVYVTIPGAICVLALAPGPIYISWLLTIITIIALITHPSRLIAIIIIIQPIFQPRIIICPTQLPICLQLIIVPTIVIVIIICLAASTQTKIQI